MSAGLLLAGGAVATALGVLGIAQGRWAWAAASALVAAWTATTAPAAGALLLVAVIAATAAEDPRPPAPPGFEAIVSRLLTLAAATAGGALLVVRVLDSDLAALPAVGLLGGLAIAAVAHLVGQSTPGESSRAARLAAVVAAAAWCAGGHPVLATAALDAVVVLAIAWTPRRVGES